MIYTLSLMHIHASAVVEALALGEKAVRKELNRLLKENHLSMQFSYDKEGEKNETFIVNLSPSLMEAGVGELSLEYIRTEYMHIVTYWVETCMMLNATLDLRTNEFLLQK